MGILSRFYLGLFWWFVVFWFLFFFEPSPEIFLHRRPSLSSEEWFYRSIWNPNPMEMSCFLFLYQAKIKAKQKRTVPKAIISYFSVSDFQMKSSTSESPQHHPLPSPSSQNHLLDFWLCPCWVRTPRLTVGSSPSHDFVPSCFSCFLFSLTLSLMLDGSNHPLPSPSLLLSQLPQFWWAPG